MLFLLDPTKVLFPVKQPCAIDYTQRKPPQKTADVAPPYRLLQKYSVLASMWPEQCTPGSVVTNLREILCPLWYHNGLFFQNCMFYHKLSEKWHKQKKKWMDFSHFWGHCQAGHILVGITGREQNIRPWLHNYTGTLICFISPYIWSLFQLS